MTLEKPVVVIDNGSYNMKAGFACDNHPISIFRTLVGRPEYLNGSYGKGHYDVNIGDDALENSEELELSSPIKNGIITHWDNMERIWHHVYYREIRCAPEDRALVLATSPVTTMADKIKCCEVFFETLNIPAICIQSQSVLGMYGYGFTTGVCVDMGHDTTDIVPVFEGGMIKYAHVETGFAGSQMSEYIKQSLHDQDIHLNEKYSHSIEDIKQKCYVTDYGAMPRRNCVRSYKLPSGEEIDVTNEAFMGGEIIFNPYLVFDKKVNYLPLHEAIFTAVAKCDAELHTELYNTIGLCGGLSMIPRVNKRLALEIQEITETPFEIMSSPESYSVAWLGGTVFASLGDSNKMSITKQQYEDYGEKIIRNKFLY